MAPSTGAMHMNFTDVHRRDRGLTRIARLEVPALCIGNAVGSCGAAVIPLWVAAVLKTGALSTTEVGWLASGELSALAISVLAVSAWGKHGSPRRVAAFAASAVVAANVVAMLSAVQTLVIGRLLSGLAWGALLASVTGGAARRLDAQRVLALMQAAMLVLTSVVYLVSPMLLGRFGPAGLFAILAGLGVVMLSAALVGLSDAATTASVVVRAASVHILPPIIGCVALATAYIGQNTIATYIIVIGNAHGIDARTMSIVLAIAAPLAMLGPFAAHRLGERLGLLRPLILGQLLLAIDILCLVRAASPILLCLSTAAFSLLAVFSVPYAITLLSRLDASGRFASAAPAFMLVGAAIGPALGSKIIDTTGFQTLALVAASCITVGIALFMVAASLGDIKVKPNSTVLTSVR